MEMTLLTKNNYWLGNFVQKKMAISKMPFTWRSIVMPAYLILNLSKTVQTATSPFYFRVGSLNFAGPNSSIIPLSEDHFLSLQKDKDFTLSQPNHIPIFIPSSLNSLQFEKLKTALVSAGNFL